MSEDLMRRGWPQMPRPSAWIWAGANAAEHRERATNGQSPPGSKPLIYKGAKVPPPPQRAASYKTARSEGTPNRRFLIVTRNADAGVPGLGPSLQCSSARTVATPARARRARARRRS
jgi:hypothetical protein